MENTARLAAAAVPAFRLRPRVPQLRPAVRAAASGHFTLDLIRIPTANLLVVGRQHEIRGLLSLLTPELRQPVVMRAPGEPLRLPSVSSSIGTLIVHDVGTLTPAEQQALLDWLDQPKRQARVISTATASLMTMIEKGAFSDLLYYRLNTVCVCLD